MPGKTVRVPQGSVVSLSLSSPRLAHAERIVRTSLPGFRIASGTEGAPSPSLFVSIEETSADEGAFTITSSEKGGAPRICINGGGVPGVVYGANELFARHIARDEAGGLSFQPLAVSESPGLPYRILWTWDHSTNWFLEQTGIQEIGALNYYMKPSGGFFEDYRRLVDFMSLNRIGAVTIYGFLRDNHGGIEAARQLCEYATERGVRIMPGVGINAYGGIYWEGNNRFNLTTWLRKNPHLRAVLGKPAAFHIPDVPELWFPDNQYTDAACPSRPENAAFHEEAIRWLAETFPIGGINFETGDYGTCHCVDCSARRKEDSSWSFRDMALLYPRLFEAALASGRDLWLVSEAYWDTILDREALKPLEALPDTAIYQFCINRSYWPRLQKELTAEHVAALPRRRNIFRTHMGSQWNGERHELVARRFADLARLAHETGMKGLTIFGEASAFETVNEINYLAFARFGYHPTLSWDAFVQNDLGPLFGGASEARKYLELLTVPSEAAALDRASSEAAEIARAARGDAVRRWIWLQNRLFRKRAMARS
ncbi:MAG TPA: hypothetical protein VMU36_14315 [Spirochaetia bacterium]|nr:hypothetical protein [Spirochaetia bacterium]